MSEKFSKRFEKIDKTGKSKEIQLDSITKKGSLGEGLYGEVSAVEIEIDGYPRNFAIKDYSKKGEGSIELAKQAYKNYLQMKALGLKVFPTARISKDKPQLLLTLGTQKDFVLISKDSHIKWDKVKELTNLKELILSMAQNVLLGSKEKIEIRNDSYFFIINKQNPTDADFVIGDYERMNLSDIEPIELFTKNLKSAEKALVSFVDMYIENDEAEQKKYENIIQEEISNFRELNSEKFT